MPGLWFSKLESASELPGSLVKTQITEPHPGVSVSICLKWVPRICISNKFPGDAAATDLGTDFEDHRSGLASGLEYIPRDINSLGLG